MKFVLVLLFSAALGLKLSEHELPDCTGTKELAKKNGDQWRCDEFSGQNEACGSRYQEHNGATFQCVVRPAGSGVTNCLTGHRCKVPEVCPAKQLESLGNGFCSSGQIYGSHAWELASSSGGIKGFDTPEYEAWVQTAWKKCLEKDAETVFVSVWKDAGYRCYKATTCGPNGDSGTRSWAPAFSLKPDGYGHCSSGQIYGSHAWELAPSSVGVKDFNTPEYKAWVQAAWGKCLEKDAGTKYVSVWKDAGYRCYTAATCGATDGASSFTRSWAPAPCGTLTVAQPPQPQAPQAQVCPAKQLESLGNGFCSSGQIYGSHAWELASSSGGIKGFDTPEYEAWVQTAWKKCLEKDAETAFVSVWKDAGYRCYKATTCGPNGDSFTRSWAPAFSLKPDGYGHCSSGQIYGSHAWELAPSSVGVKDFNTPEYKAWVQAAWGKCLEKDAGTKYVSVWKDAGYRCYVAATCGATDGASSFTRSWAPAFSLKPDGYGHCSSGQIYGSHAWELAPSSVGVKDFNTPEYKAWVQAAWGKCLEKDAGTKYVSVWKDAGYRCYTAATCGATDGAGSFTRSWTSAALPC